MKNQTQRILEFKKGGRNSLEPPKGKMWEYVTGETGRGAAEK